MSLVKVSGNASGTGTLTIAAPNTNTDYTLTLPQATTTLVGTDATQTLTNKTIQGGAITSGTAVSLSGTAVEFTSIPSWVKRITLMLYSGVSTNGTSVLQVQIGSGSYSTSGYTGAYGVFVNASASSWASVTTGFPIANDNAPDTRNGTMVLTLAGSNTWVTSGMFITTNRGIMTNTTGFLALGGALDRIRLTTVNGTDTFDAGSINILYE